MRQRTRLIFYILLNIFVSACVTGTMLYLYDRTLRPADGTIAAPLQTPAPITGESSLEIVSVIGAGAASSEMVVIRNTGAEAVLLTGWFLQNDSGEAYPFPQLTLNPDGTVQVHTAAGSDSAIDLYWGRVASVWKSGGTARLYDPQGVERARYSIP